MLLKYQAQHIQHMQKALTQMNVQLANVISDIVGETGQKIIRASEAEIARALQGNWRTEHLFALKQGVALYDAYNEQLRKYDRQLEALLATYPL